jgi:hypothetical protein
MEESRLVSYEEALDILNGLPPPIRTQICERIIDYLIRERDGLARLATLPEWHIEKSLGLYRISSAILKGLEGNAIDFRDAPSAMFKLIDE